MLEKSPIEVKRKLSKKRLSNGNSKEISKDDENVLKQRNLSP